MLLTANRRFAFSASRRLARDGRSAAENERLWGAGEEREWGSGENYQAYFVFAGEPDPRTGMLVNLAEVKRLFKPLLDERYDHRFLNRDTPPFDRVVPTPENVAAALLDEAGRASAGVVARLVACHLRESPHSGATAWGEGRVERDLFLEFSAARRTCSPHLTDAENDALFGRAASPAGHGHGYRLRVTLAGNVDAETGLVACHEEVAAALADLHALLDHRHLNLEVAELVGEPITTECLARFVYRRLAGRLPVVRVRLHEMPHFFAEHDGTMTALGLERSFSAAHRLQTRGLSDEENFRVFGKCSNPNGHGHRYTVQATVAGVLDERTGTVFALGRLDQALTATLAAWDHRHLDLEVAEFRDRPSTGENIVAALWPRLAPRLDGKLVRLRVFETENNRFTLRNDR
jgi:6-pyruvoyltetrahydropterin/6-carboxytetrahydropterin synthase